MATMIVKVTYTTKPEYAAQNAANIQQVMADLKQLADPGIHYFVSVAADGKTFTHTALFQAPEGQKTLLALPAFQHFQAQLKASGPEVPPHQEMPTMVGGVGAIFPLESGLA